MLFFSEAVESGVGMGGCHGECDSFRWSVEYQFITAVNGVSPGDTWYHHMSELSKENLEYVQKFYPTPEGLFKLTTWQYKESAASQLLRAFRTLRFIPNNIICMLTLYKCTGNDQVNTIGPHSANGPVAMPVVYTKLWEKEEYFTALDMSIEYLMSPKLRLPGGLLWAARKR
jgi:type 1 glutamine amidotransferase